MPCGGRWRRWPRLNNAQREHQEFMASIDAVAQENGSVLTALAHDGVAVFPAGTVYDALWSDLAGGRRCLRFGLDGAGDIRGTVQASTEGTRLRIEGAVRIDDVVLATFGVHNARNALAAAACAHAAGIDEASIAHGLARFTPVKGRLQRKRATSGALVIDDTYNANPDSVRAAIDVLAALPAPRWLVLGDMGEVGDQGAGEIAELAAIAQPTVGLVNNAQREHQEFMKTVDAVAVENGSVIAALPSHGVAVFPGDDPFTPLWRDMAGHRRVITFGAGPESDVWADAQWQGELWALRLHTPQGEAQVRLRVAGRHNVRNALAAAAAALGASTRSSCTASTPWRAKTAPCWPPSAPPAWRCTRPTTRKPRCGPRWPASGPR